MKNKQYGPIENWYDYETDTSFLSEWTKSRFNWKEKSKHLCTFMLSLISLFIDFAVVKVRMIILDILGPVRSILPHS